jgi:Uma2 family endonuclease
VISPIKRKVELFRLDASGHWVLHEYHRSEPVELASLELTIDSSALYENVA